VCLIALLPLPAPSRSRSAVENPATLCDLQLFSWFTERFRFVAKRGSRFVGERCRGEFEQVTRLALQCRADRIECREADGACLSCFENRQVGERD